MQAVSNVSSNILLEYFMFTTIFETLAQVWFIPSIGFNSNCCHTNAKIIDFDREIEFVVGLVDC